MDPNPGFPEWIAVRWDTVRDDVRFWCLLAGSLLLLVVFIVPAVALSRPVFSYVFVVDITRSMNVADYELDGLPASRLDFIKHALHQALQDLPCQSRVGLGIFTERDSHLLFEPVEVCENFSAIDEAIQQLDWRMAWAADSYIGKGLISAIGMVASLDANLAFFTDGHQAPPENPSYKTVYEGKPGKVNGFIVGVGGHELMRIPKFNEEGERTGFYSKWDVPHVSRFGLPTKSVQGMMDDQAAAANPRNAPFGGQRVIANEHLSSVHEVELREYSAQTGLRYHHLQDAQTLSAALQTEALAATQTVAADIRWAPASCALALLIFMYGVVPLIRRWE